MSKSNLKRSIAIDQSGIDPLTNEPLSPVPSLLDTDRVTPKADGGTYDDRSNVRVLNPRSHMARHGNLRDREASLEHLKSIFDDRVQVMKLQLKMNNQLLAYERRTDHKNDVTAAFITEQLKSVAARLAQIDKELTRAIKAHPDQLAQVALKVPGIGPITAAALTVYVDFNKKVCSRCRRVVASHDVPETHCGKASSVCACKGQIDLVDATATPSSLWKYVGIHCASHERYTKGQASGGNKTLRTVLWNTANTMMKMRECKYREVYDRTKLRLANSDRVVKTRNTQGALVETAWRDTKPSHRHGAALRAIVKHLLADYWMVGRTLAGLRTTPLYVQAMLGHTHIVSPSERGWDF